MQQPSQASSLETATLGGGCFWCLEAVYDGLDGVVDVVSGYAGGTVANPSYQQVCSGQTGHAEVVKISYPAEDYHQNYFAENREQGYCRVVVAPKVAKFRRQFTDRLKPV
ncbi:MAG: peptide-methionine (S)-S-oxide reductase [Trueperaceae bacterium]|nr:MAG: peptide-methionine (S)-S-oxide reductase [Trueperaceae bacterium]